MDLQVQQVPCPVENIRSTSKYTVLFREEKLWLWRRFEEGLHKNRQMRTLTANLAKLIPNKSFHGRSGAANVVWDLVDEIHTGKCHHHL